MLKTILLAAVLATASATPAEASYWRMAGTLTWYGNGLYGHRTACGLRLTRTLVGVASRTLKCGTKVKFRWHHTTIVVPVVDRGPYPDRSLYREMPFDMTAGAVRLWKRWEGDNPYFTRHNVRYHVMS